MVKNSTTIHEGRTLPLSAMAFALLLGAIIFASTQTLFAKISAAILMLLAAGGILKWTFYPRRVLRLESDRLIYHDLRTRKTTELSLPSIIGVSIEKEYSTVGELGWGYHLVLKTAGDALRFPLYSVGVSHQRLLELIRGSLATPASSHPR